MRPIEILPQSLKAIKILTTHYECDADFGSQGNLPYIKIYVYGQFCLNLKCTFSKIINGPL